MYSDLSTFLAFIVNLIFEVYIIIVLFRFLLQLFKADYYNPLSQWVLRLTSYSVTPLQRFIPSYKQINLSALFLLLLLGSLKIITYLFINNDIFPHIYGVLIWTMGDLIDYTSHIFFYAIFIQAILSWFRTPGASILLQVLNRLTLPLLRPMQRILPTFGGLDLSPIPVLFILKLISVYVALPLQAWGSQLALSNL